MFNTQNLRDHAALIRKMDAIANEDGMIQTHEATARMLDRAATEIDRLHMQARWKCRSCEHQFTFGEIIVGQAGAACPVCGSLSMFRETAA